jgi:hypothetical protein
MASVLSAIMLDHSLLYHSKYISIYKLCPSTLTLPQSPPILHITSKLHSFFLMTIPVSLRTIPIARTLEIVVLQRSLPPLILPPQPTTSQCASPRYPRYVLGQNSPEHNQLSPLSPTTPSDISIARLVDTVHVSSLLCNSILLLTVDS